MAADGSGQRKLTNSPGRDLSPTISPDGRRIAFWSDRDGNEEIYVMDADGTDQTRLTSTITWEAQPTWSPDGESLLFISNRAGNFDIYRMSANGGPAVAVTDNLADESTPAWSPDGTKIAYARAAPGPGGGGYPKEDGADVLVKDLVTGATTNVTATPNQDESAPAWSPDGTKLAVHWRDVAQQASGIVVIPSTGGAATFVAGTSSGSEPAWSPDGSWIAFALSHYFVDVVPAAGGSPVQLSDGSDDHPDWGVLSHAGPCSDGVDNDGDGHVDWPSDLDCTSPDDSDEQPQRPQNTVRPTVTGTPVRGSPLSCSLGTWAGSDPKAFAQQWLRDDTPIDGATGASHTVADADLGHTLACRVTATNAAGSEAATSDGVDVSSCPSGQPVCVVAVRVEQPDLPARHLVEVPPGGVVHDGNRVRLTATVRNGTNQSITTPIRFRDLSTARALPAAGRARPPDEVDVPPREDHEVVLDWDTWGFAWYPPGAPAPHDVVVETPYDVAHASVAVRPRPVMLVHGWRSGAGTWAGYPALLARVRHDWPAHAVTGMDTNAWHGKSLVENAKALASQIEATRNSLDAEHVDLVAHSLGGLISRQYLHSLAPDGPDGRPVVAHLVMLGTPNRGSKCADFVYNFMRGLPTLEMTVSYVEGRFNPEITQTNGTKLSALAGIADLPSQRFTAFVCGLELPNDPVVWRESALWNVSDRVVMSDVHHLQMTDSERVFADWVKPHLVETDPPVEPSSKRQSASRRREPTRQSRAAEPMEALDLVAARSMRLGGGAHGRVAFTVGRGKELGILLVAPATVAARLVDPRGHAVERTTGNTGLAYLRAPRPTAGRWTVDLRNMADTAAEVGLGARVAGDRFRLRGTLARGRNKRLTLVVRVTRKARVSATVASVGRPMRTRKIRLRARGSRRYTATIRQARGGTAVRVNAISPNGERTLTLLAP